MAWKGNKITKIVRKAFPYLEESPNWDIPKHKEIMIDYVIAHYILAESYFLEVENMGGNVF